jgi:hypothetical protein
MTPLGSSISLKLHLLTMLVIIYDRHMFIVQATGYQSYILHLNVAPFLTPVLC